MAAIHGRFARRASRFWCAGIAIWTLLAYAGCVVREGELDTEQLPRASGNTGPARTSGLGVAVASAAGSVSGNHLTKETSPYLLAHARDPVDWHPWNAETLERARREGKLIFVSVGYSSCHWCHMMTRTVFADPAIARYMNEHFVNIQIDREERPDLDELLLSALTLYYQAIGSPQTGGWPVSLFLTPDGKPLGGGTYFPPTDEPGRPGFPSVMQRVVQSWRDNREQMVTNANLLEQALQSTSRPRVSLRSASLDRGLVDQVLQRIRGSHDAQFGGFGFDSQNPDRAKFPLPTRLALLQFSVEKSHDEPSIKMLGLTLDRMAAGGLHDHLGGGFHRYCTDRQWRLPHFEKMLYDNALLVDIYTSAWEQTHNSNYRDVAERAAAFILRDLSDPSGGFYSALDADSEETEGKYYTWTPAQISSAIPAADRAIFSAVYRVNPADGSDLGGGVLEQTHTTLEAATARKLSERQLTTRLTEIRRDLLAARQQRTSPLRDEKIVTAWNGLAIHCLAHAGSVLGRTEYIQAAEKAATWILAQLRDDQGRLLHCDYRGQPHGTAFLDDYAFLVHGLLALHRATGDIKWLNAARRLTDQQFERFWDSKQKGCYFAPADHEVWMTRSKHAYDGSLPAGNSVTARNLLRLTIETQEPSYRERAREILELFAPQASESPEGMTSLALALGEYFSVQKGGDDAGVGPSKALEDPGANGTSRERSRGGGGSLPTGAPNPEELTDRSSNDELPDPGSEASRNPRRESAPAAPGSSEKKSPAKTPDVVTGKVYLSVDRLPPGKTCRAIVHLKIEEPWHINANPAQPDYVKPTVLTLKSSRYGVKMQVRYPKAEELPAKDGEEKALVYSRNAFLSGLLTIPAEAAGQQEELIFEVKYQACAQSCQPPKTLQLKAVVDVAAEGDEVKAINEKLFSPARRK